MSLPKQIFLIETTVPKDSKLKALSVVSEERMPVVMNDESIIRQVIGVDASRGFEMIYKRYFNQLCSHALRFVYSTCVAEDIVGEVFFDFWRKSLYLTVKTTYRTYLYTAVRNRSLNYLKSEFGSKQVVSDTDALTDYKKDSGDPQSILLFDELLGKLNHSINDFSPQCQRVFLLSRVEGKKNREIAEALKINIKTVEAHMMKALSILRKSLADYFE